MFAFLPCAWLEVRRKGAYKGKQVHKDKIQLPMDACTVPGILLCLACYLSARGLRTDQVNQCTEIMKKLDSRNQVCEVMKLLPHNQHFFIEIENNRIHTEQLKEAVSQIGISWSRTEV